MNAADLHLHTCHSDGKNTPARVVERAVEAGLQAMAITDHDTVSAVPEAQRAAQARDIAFLTGVEISARQERTEVHVVGLGIDPDEPGLHACLRELQAARAERGERMLRRLCQLGVPVEVEAVRDEAEGRPVSRMHIAYHLRTLGITKTTQEGFDRFLKPGREAYVSKTTCAVDTALARIHGAGGLAFVAHPGLSRSLRKLLPALLEQPFDGIEAYHISHSAGRTRELLELAEARGLLVAGGSDCHGAMKGAPEMGKVRLPMRYVDAIRERLQSRR